LSFRPEFISSFVKSRRLKISDGFIAKLLRAILAMARAGEFVAKWQMLTLHAVKFKRLMIAGPIPTIGLPSLRPRRCRIQKVAHKISPFHFQAAVLIPHSTEMFK
jgi:hypothetical protein